MTAAIVVTAAVLGLYCLLRWAITADDRGAAVGRHRASAVPTGVLRAATVLADQDRLADQRQAHMRAAIAHETGTT